MTPLINLVLLLIKWPVALLSVLALPAAALTLIWLLLTAYKEPGTTASFLIGVGIYWVLDKLIFGRRDVGSWFSTFEHEITHAIFAWATLHRVIGLHVTAHNGGHIRYVGGGNWLISVSPYWFPTLCVPIILYASVFSDPHPAWAIALGLTFMFHHLSTWRETHAGQTDLQETGLLFAWMFLPTANLVAGGTVIAFASGNTALIVQFFIQLKLNIGDTFSLLSF